jgi:transcriptional regulator with XRE-family HTH domain
MSISPKEPKYLDASHLLNRLSKKSLSFSALLEAIRLGEDATLTDFSKKLGISRSHLCDIEQGRKTVSPARAATFARKLGYSQKHFIALALQDIVKKDGFNYVVKLEAA